MDRTQLGSLAANTGLMTEIRDALAAGKPAYAECGGLMYLSRSITWQGRTARMVGAIPGDAVMHARPVGRGYVQLHSLDDHPWGNAGEVVRGHEFHHSSLDNLDPGVRFAFRVQRGHGVDGRHDGVRVHHLLATYAHQRHGAGSRWVTGFMAQVQRERTRRASARRATAPAHAL